MNRLAELSGIDVKKLQKEIDALFHSNFNLETIGYSTADVTFKLVHDDDQELEPPEAPVTSQVAVSRPGDCWMFHPKGVAPIAANFGNAARSSASCSACTSSISPG